MRFAEEGGRDAQGEAEEGGAARWEGRVLVLGRGFGEGEFDAEVGALAGLGGDGDVAAVFFDDAAGGGEAEAGAGFLGGELGFEDAGEEVGGDAGAGVGDVDEGVVAGGVGADDELAPCDGVHR